MTHPAFLWNGDHSKRFQNAEPFPHIVLDGLWDDDWLDLIAWEFPSVHDSRWKTYPDPKEWGKRAGGSEMWGEHTKSWFNIMRQPDTCNALVQLTKIGPLTPDEIGGGYHMTSEGGRLATHVDFNIHPYNNTLERRLNVLLFLNHDWDDSWGGVLYLGQNREVAVSPQFNRTVIFATSDISWHGHPDAVVGWHHRKSLACYFYAPRRVETANSHSTIWQ